MNKILKSTVRRYLALLLLISCLWLPSVAQAQAGPDGFNPLNAAWNFAATAIDKTGKAVTGIAGVPISAAKILGSLVWSGPSGAAKTAIKEITGSDLTEVILTPLEYVVWIYTEIVNFLIRVLTSLLGPLLGAHGFITHPFVRIGWPFIQGLANIGFILALLFIAFATTLQLQIGNVYRLLPRLLLAALLINFSLVIAGILIDVSQITMAIMVNTLGAGSADNIAARLEQSSGLVQIQNSVPLILESTIKEHSGIIPLTTQVVNAVLSTFFIIALITIIAGLFMRYVMLVLLLIISPLAFLGFALPNTEKLAKKWWSEFIKYIIYGPVVAFVLVVIQYVGGEFTFTAPSTLEGWIWTSTMQGIAALCITVFMMFAAARTGKYLGVAGAGAALSWATKQGKSAAQGAWGIGTAPYRYVGKKAGKEAAYQIKHTRGYQAVAAPFQAVQDYFDIRNQARGKADAIAEKARKDTSRGTIRGREDYDSPALKKSVADVRAGLGSASSIASIELADLRNKDVGKRLSDSEVNTLVGSTLAYTGPDKDRKISAIVNNIEMVRRMNAKAKADIEKSASSDLIKALHNTERRIDDEDRRAGEKAANKNKK